MHDSDLFQYAQEMQYSSTWLPSGTNKQEYVKWSIKEGKGPNRIYGQQDPQLSTYLDSKYRNTLSIGTDGPVQTM